MTKALRDVVPSDSEMLLAWRNLPEVSKYMYTDHEITRAEHDEWFARVLNDLTKRFWILMVDGADVGLVNVTDIDLHNSRCTWAFYIAETAQRGRGVGAFAEFEVLRYVFEELRLNRLWCEVLDFNTSAQKMHRRFGFVHEGTRRQHIMKDGEYHDVEVFSILKEEWDKGCDALESDLTRKRVFE